MIPSITLFFKKPTNKNPGEIWLGKITKKVYNYFKDCYQRQTDYGFQINPGKGKWFANGLAGEYKGKRSLVHDSLLHTPGYIY